MQDEREPDIMGADDDVLEEKVREMMDPKPKKSQPKLNDKQPETSTAPELDDAPVPKEPLKIKVTSEGPEEETATAPELPPKPTKKITVKHDEVADDSQVMISQPDAEVESKTEEEPLPLEVPVEAVVTKEITTEELPEKDVTESIEENADDIETVETGESKSPEVVTDEEPQPEVQSEEAAEEPPLPPVSEDGKTKDAVDDIVAHESDELLAVQDEKVAAFQPPKKKTLKQKISSFFAAWWHSSRARWLTLSAIFLGLAVSLVIPTSRYFLLNTAHVRSGLSVQVLDNSTQQPLKNVKVSVGDASGTTDAEGRARLTGVKLGPADLKIEKRAFATLSQHVTVGWGSNPLGEFKLIPTGTQYALLVTDYLSGKGVESVEVSSGEANAQSDKEGKILLTMDQPPDEFEVTVKGQGYREEKLKLNADIKAEQPIRLVPSRKAVFISRRSGVYDVYKVDIDGKNEEKIVAGTGSERDDILLLPHPKDEVVAVVSTRENARNSDGFLLSTLTVVDLSDNSSTAPARSEQIRLLGWVNDRLIYMQATAGTSAANPKRQRIMSYNFTNNDNKELFTSNYFNDLGVIGTKIYFAPSGAYQAGNIGLFSLEADGTNKQTIISKEVWNFTRTSFDHLSLSVGNEWYDLKLGDKAPTKLPGQPANLNSRMYTDSPDAKKSLWVDNRDGKGVLLAYEPSTQNEQVLRTQSGLKNPVRWLTNNVVIYRINTEQETADYALSLQGGEPQKIRDVTHTSGTDGWYYY